MRQLQCCLLFQPPWLIDSVIADDVPLNETDATMDPTTHSSTVDDGSEDLFFDGSGNTTTTDDVSVTMGDNITVSGNATDVVVDVPAIEPSVNETAVDAVEDDVGVNATNAIIDINATSSAGSTLTFFLNTYPMGAPCTPRNEPFVMAAVNTLRSAAKLSYLSFGISESAGRL